MDGFIKNLSFKKRDIPIPADYRPLYKIGHILLILSISSRSGKSSMLKLHFLCWTIKSKKNINVVKEWINKDFKNDFYVWGVEPTVNRAVAFAVADEFIINDGGDFLITQKGIDFFKVINKDKELFVSEKKFLIEIGKNTITEQIIKNLSAKLF